MGNVVQVNLGSEWLILTATKSAGSNCNSLFVKNNWISSNKNIRNRNAHILENWQRK